MEKPEIMVSYFVTVAETREEAEYQGKPSDIARIMLRKGDLNHQRMTPEEAKDFEFTELDKMWLEDTRSQHLIGTPKEVADYLLKDQAKYGFDEAMICTIPHSQEQRLNVYRLLAKELL